MRIGIVVGLVGCAALLAPAARAFDGQASYDRYCAGCHGAAGDGEGPAEPMLIVKPRDFTKGVFKFRSTPAGMLPTDDDLYRTITRGITRTSMPGWSLLPERERWALVRAVKHFYPSWKEPSPSDVVPVPPAPELAAPERVARGRAVYELLECGTCHGDSGRGDGPSAADMGLDAWGHPQRPFNMTRGSLKSGDTPEDVYRTFMTGLSGTAMPSYGDIFAEPDGEYVFEGDAWALVSYVLSLRGTSVPGEER